MQFNFSSTRFKNSPVFQKDAGKDVSILLVSLFHSVGIDIGRSAHLGMAQPFADTYTVHAIEIEQAGHTVSERVRVDMRQPMTLAELSNPVVHTVRVHRLSIVL